MAAANPGQCCPLINVLGLHTSPLLVQIVLLTPLLELSRLLRRRLPRSWAWLRCAAGRGKRGGLAQHSTGQHNE
jgi:hypothetical protein